MQLVLCEDRFVRAILGKLSVGKLKVLCLEDARDPFSLCLLWEEYDEEMLSASRRSKDTVFLRLKRIFTFLWLHSFDFFQFALKSASNIRVLDSMQTTVLYSRHQSGKSSSTRTSHCLGVSRMLGTDGHFNALLRTL